MIKLGVNIDHVATLRQARGGKEPDVLEAAVIAHKAGAEGITVHLREDRRHIQDSDVLAIKKKKKISLNLEMAVAPEIISFALSVLPEKVCLVPEKREEKTTEGGLDLLKDPAKIAQAVAALKQKGIQVSLFVEPEPEIIDAAHAAGADCVELHTGAYANAFETDDPALWKKELIRLHNAAQEAYLRKMIVNAGHGLNYHNVEHVVKIPHLAELNIGHSIVARAMSVGLSRAVKEMKQVIEKNALKENE